MIEGPPKTAPKILEQQLADLRELQRALVEARKAQDAPAAEALMKENWDRVFSRETTGLSFEEVEHLLGKDFFGPEAIEKIFGVQPETVPAVPFSKEELERAKELGQQLIFYIDFMAVEAGSSGPVTLENMRKVFTKSHDGGKVFASHGSDDFWYKNEDFFRKEKPRTGWRLTSKELIPNSTSKNYIEQTDVLVGHLQNTVFKGMELPKQYTDAIIEFNRKRAEIKSLAESSTGTELKKGSQMLADLAITRLVRELPVEVMYRLILNDQQNKDKQLPSKFTSTAGRTSDGGLVDVGGFDGTGTGVNDAGPAARDGNLGVSFSRR